MGDEHLKMRGLESKIHGLPPMKSIDLDMYTGQAIPNNWDITGVTGDILMIEYADEVGDDGEYVDRGGVLVNASVSKDMWRVGKILLAGPGASDQCEVGSYVLFPNNKGIPITKFDGKNLLFINEERVFCHVKPKEKTTE